MKNNKVNGVARQGEPRSKRECSGVESGLGQKIAIVIRHIKIGGGAERVAVSLGNELYKKGYDVHFIVFENVEDKHETKVPIFCLDNFKIRNSLGAFRAIFKRGKQIKKFCEKRDVDVIVSFMEESNFASIISKMIYKNKVRIIVSLRNNPERKKFFARKLMKFLYPKADVVVSNSVVNNKKLKNKFNLNNVVTINNQIDYEKIEELKKEKISLRHRHIFDSGRIFINIGRLTEQKGHKYLIKAFRKVVDDCSDCKLIIIGEGKLRNELENLISSLGLGKKIFLLENQKNVFPYLFSSDFFVFSSLWEGMPNVILESLAVGLPVVSTDCETGPREILSPKNINEKIDYPYKAEYGVLVPIEDEDKLSRAMIDLISNSDKNIKIIDRFKEEEVIKKWEELIND